ncbi:hypothetical protein [Streptomyces sp. NBC_01465]|uniref:hypothetical protein n=1 Tax=Streptomyces sp. NBC_01465 TaxID=2903878 RepID=UPI002E3522FF|nr:hypothetical protein [Streptomyces sp. NBC_01465]
MAEKGMREVDTLRLKEFKAERRGWSVDDVDDLLPAIGLKEVPRLFAASERHADSGASPGSRHPPDGGARQAGVLKTAYVPSSRAFC